MTRLFWYAMMLALVLAAAAGVSWVLAYYTVNGVLGSPPPQKSSIKSNISCREHPIDARNLVSSSENNPSAPSLLV